MVRRDGGSEATTGRVADDHRAEDAKDGETGASARAESRGEPATERTPAFSVVPVVRTPEVNPGGTVEIAIYVTGHGKAEHAEIFAKHPAMIFRKEPIHPKRTRGTNPSRFKIGELVFNFVWVGKDLPLRVKNPAAFRTWPLRDYGVWVHADALLVSDSDARRKFERREDSLLRDGKLKITTTGPDGGEKVVKTKLDPPRGNEIAVPGIRRGTTHRRETLPKVMGEHVTTNGENVQPPLLLRYNVKTRGQHLRSKARKRVGNRFAALGRKFGFERRSTDAVQKAPAFSISGDYSIPFVLTYTDEDDTYQHEATAEFRVNNLIEQYAFRFEAFGITLVVVSILLELLDVSVVRNVIQILRGFL